MTSECRKPTQCSLYSYDFKILFNTQKSDALILHKGRVVVSCFDIEGISFQTENAVGLRLFLKLSMQVKYLFWKSKTFGVVSTHYN